MNTNRPPSLSELFPLPKGVKLPTYKFGTNPVAPLQTVSLGEPAAHAGTPRSPFKITWEDKEQGLKVCVEERQENSHLIANVYGTHEELLNKAAVSVALMGTNETEVIRKTVPLCVAETNGTFRCSGSADLGLLADAVQRLGDRIGLVVFLVQ